MIRFEYKKDSKGVFELSIIHNNTSTKVDIKQTPSYMIEIFYLKLLSMLRDKEEKEVDNLLEFLYDICGMIKIDRINSNFKCLNIESFLRGGV